MVVVKLEMHPPGSTPRSVGEIRIWNVGGDEQVGAYSYEVRDDDGRVSWHGRINKFKRSLGAQELVRVVLNDASEP